MQAAHRLCLRQCAWTGHGWRNRRRLCSNRSQAWSLPQAGSLLRRCSDAQGGASHDLAGTPSLARLFLQSSVRCVHGTAASRHRLRLHGKHCVACGCKTCTVTAFPTVSHNTGNLVKFPTAKQQQQTRISLFALPPGDNTLGFLVTGCYMSVAQLTSRPAHTESFHSCPCV